MRRLGIFLFILICWVSGAEAGCSGSGTSWSCTAGSTSGQISAALSSAADGATLTFATGSYSWNSFVSFSNTKGVTLICSTVGGCNVTATGTVLGMNGNLSGANSKFYRVSGFNFTGGASFIIWFYGPGIMQRVRIDHNSFNASSGTTALMFGENTTVANFYGVVDHNTFSSSGSIAAFQYIGAVNPSPPPSPAGTASNLFFEDNTITVTTMTDAGLGCIDGWGGNAVVYRHNTSTNCLVTMHGATHAGGPQNVEFYNNITTVNSGAAGQSVSDCYRCFHHQGSGEFYAFNNRFTASGGKNSDALAMMDYRAYANSIDGGAPICDGTQAIDGNRSPTATNRGYPCWHQAGRDFATSPVGGNLKPMYVWNNAWSDTLAMIPMTLEDLGGAPDYTPQHQQANRDYYNAVSASAQISPTIPFNGTTGMGFGTLANRPTTCTTNTLETGGGVGYFAIDQGAQGTLYRCSATNTWTVHYTPYTYPHPLVIGSVAAHDFDGDGKSDIAWRDTSGNTAVWLMNGAQLAQSAGIGTAPTTWSVVGQRDFDGDGKHDWIWRDNGGNVAIWFLNGAQIRQSAGVGNVPTTWSIVGTADFNGDGKGDILWGDTGGNLAIWLMNGAQVTQSAGIGSAPTAWSLVGIGDFDGDGKSDVLWRDTSGNVAVWLMNGAQIAQSAGIGNVPSNWTIVGTGDFNGDGKSDILWRDTSGNVAIWLMNGAQPLQTSGVGTAPNTWSVAETGDYNGDGKSDILWRDTSGNVATWFMNGLQITQSVGVGNAPIAWSVQGVNAD
jgi:VCBS repeat protein